VTCVLSPESVEVAASEWAKGGLKTRLVPSAASLVKKSASRGSGGGFGSSDAASKSSSPMRVLILTRPNKAMLTQLQPLIEPLGNEVVVVLVNPARLKSGKGRPGYAPAFVLRDNPHPDWRGGLLYYRYAQQWVLGVAAAGGRAVVHGRSDERPSLEELDSGFAKIKDDSSLLSQAGGLLSAAGAAAALERRGGVSTK
jgi:hypothetical protein